MSVEEIKKLKVKAQQDIVDILTVLAKDSGCRLDTVRCISDTVESVSRNPIEVFYVDIEMSI